MFDGCSKLESISIPESVSVIGDCAFRGTSNITGRMNISENIKEIGSNAFRSSGINSVIIPSSVTSIGDYAFAECSNLSDVNLSKSISKINEGTFMGCGSLNSINIPEGVVRIDDNAFSGCYSLTNLKLPYSLREIGNYTFCGCDGFTNLVIPEGVTKFDSYTFTYCSNLKSISLPNSFGSTGVDPFAVTDKLKAIWIPGTKESRRLKGYYRSFDNDPHSTLVLIQADIHNIDKDHTTPITIKEEEARAFEILADGTRQEVALTKDSSGTFIHNPSIDEVGVKHYVYEAVKDGVTYESPVITVAANGSELYPGFDENNKCVVDGIVYKYNHDNYVTVDGMSEREDYINIPSSVVIGGNEYIVTSIGDYAFGGCSYLKNVNISSRNMYYLGYKSFYGCKGLESVILPSSVTCIGDDAFTNCDMNKLKFTIEDESSVDVLTRAGISENNIEILE